MSIGTVLRSRPDDSRHAHSSFSVCSPLESESQKMAWLIRATSCRGLTVTSAVSSPLLRSMFWSMASLCGPLAACGAWAWSRAMASMISSSSSEPHASSCREEERGSGERRNLTRIMGSFPYKHNG